LALSFKGGAMYIIILRPLILSDPSATKVGSGFLTLAPGRHEVREESLAPPGVSGKWLVLVANPSYGASKDVWREYGRIGKRSARKVARKAIFGQNRY